jgi:hypothetical protein
MPPDITKINPVLRPVVFRNDPRNSVNVLFLSEGFSDTPKDRAFFDKATRIIADRFVRISPFNLTLKDEQRSSLKNLFNFFSVFTPSVDSGITMEFPVNDAGEPRIGPSDAVYKNKLKEKDTVYGMSYREIYKLIYAQPKEGYEDFVTKVVEKIPVAYDNVIPSCWFKPSAVAGFVNDQDCRGKDYGLVCVLINDKYDSGISFGSYVTISLWRYSNLNLTADKKDHTPPDPDVHTPDYTKCAVVLAHELGHSCFGLGDEYVNTEFSRSESYVNDFPNLATKSKVTGLIDGFPDFDEKWLAEFVSTEARDYMKTNKKPLREYHSGDGSSAEHIPDTAFWSQYAGYKNPFPSHIIGLYEGANYDYHGVYRPAGDCLMRSAFGKGFSISAPLLKLPADLIFTNEEELTYHQDTGLLLYHSIFMDEPKKQALLAMSADPDYKAAIEAIYQETKKDFDDIKQYDLYYKGFCYVCKYAIVDKLTKGLPNRDDYLAALSGHYPLVYKKPK